MTPAGSRPEPQTGSALSSRRRIDFTLLDAVQFFFLIALIVLQLVYWQHIPQSHWLLPLYVGSLVLLAVTVLTARASSRAAVRLLDDLIVPIIILLVVFETLGYSIPALNTNWLEPALVRMDGWFFGMTGSQYLERYYTRPLLDLMHVFYVSFYFVPLSVLIVMYRRGNRAELQHTVAAIGLTFYADFFLYYIFPVLGPYRNAQIHFTRDIVASGGALTHLLRSFLDHAEIATYDSFPSGHLAATLVTIFLAYHYRLKLRGVYVFLGVMIVISTVYLRYHYIMDLPAGVVVAVVIYWIAPWASRVVVFSGQSRQELSHQKGT
ncbi:MAG TPA: phosphatase PAP2 family protein [Candidatus Angelobacter sp.]|nr:phosphatase PAP2 family protein [Candidatus Angelobacter sp.]